MARFLRLSHHVEHAGVLIHIEVEVNFHAALVGMARHGVPQIPWRQLGQSHAELTGLKHVRHEVFIDGAAVAGEVVAQRHGRDVCGGHFFGWVGGVSRRAVVVKLRGPAAVDAGKDHVFRPFTHVQRLTMANLIALSIYGDGARPADVNHPQLATLKEVAHAQLFTDLTAHGDAFRDGHNPAHNNAIDMAVNHGVPVGLEYLLD
ncbi:hypothetical protein L1887_44261 [Cichorium endivia]|nr:hypothetical protein L1887_44261 [Cichorium endivia]